MVRMLNIRAFSLSPLARPSPSLLTQKLANTLMPTDLERNAAILKLGIQKFSTNHLKMLQTLIESTTMY